MNRILSFLFLITCSVISEKDCRVSGLYGDAGACQHLGDLKQLTGFREPQGKGDTSSLLCVCLDVKRRCENSGKNVRFRG